MSTTTRAFLVAAVLFWLTAFEALLGAGGGADAAGPHRATTGSSAAVRARAAPRSAW